MIGGDMLKALGSRLTYANVVATGALFVALGGGAYALSGIPDRGGVFHGCVDRNTSVLRVVSNASSCRKAKTVRRGRRRVRIPAELAIAWNQRGLDGAAGAKGDRGADGIDATTNRVTRFKASESDFMFLNGTNKSVIAICQPGERVISGGFRGDMTATFKIVASGPSPGNEGFTPTGWFVEWTNRSGSDVFAGDVLKTYVVCASP
jgi:hypothetical protein